jgi:hypothetical protein
VTSTETRRSLATPEVGRFLEEPGRFGVLATLNPDGTPHQAVVWYRGDEG